MPTFGNCVKWRQTGACSADGPREPEYDQYCNVEVQSGWSGYCECSSGFKTMEKGCGAESGGTCEAACTALFGEYCKKMFVFVF